MKHQFSLAHLTVIDSPPPEMTYIAARAGYDFVSFRPIYMGLPGESNYDLARNKRMFRDTKMAMKNTGMKLLDIELAKIYDGVDPKNYEPAFEVAAELGGNHVLSSIWTDDRNYGIERFSEICELAKPYGLTVDLEFVPIASVVDLTGAMEVLRTAKQENSGLMIDVHHFHRAGHKPDDLMDVPREWFNYLHLCDAPVDIPSSTEEMTRILREERSYVGEGGIDVASIVERLPDIPYSIELPNVKKAQDLGYEELARRCLQTAKDYLNRQVKT
ncbi:sugar phosphate isomerase/epimerase [Salibacterium salarium]|uniref:sugar phosphate isomerase/epimerase family protein n=1 Tax=Salibacterium salarium TaxID=284579 RepID=UPI0027873148|nr:TIM barrel protein [Salibacterium salarium]MDQ0298051.1 sugar phosphate isomerase/epimerase [Salibacterium salarium]